MAKRSFSAAVRGFRKEILDPSGLAEKAARKIALDMFSELILMSPVDTGLFRGNWQPAIGAAPEGVVELKDKDGNTVIAKLGGTVAGLKIGDTIMMVNNLPYAVALEEGHSKQAPKGMLRLTVKRYTPIVERVAGALGKV